MKAPFIFALSVLVGFVTEFVIVYFALPRSCGSHPTGWLLKFLCEIKITDAVIVFLTYCLVAAAVFQAYWSRTTLISLERAYVFPAWTDMDVSDSGKLTVKFRVRNVGRTSAVLKEFVVKFTQNQPLATNLNYSGAQRFEFDWGVEPNTLKPDVVIARSPFIGEQHVFGYIRYDDVFKKSRISRFGNRLFPDRQGEQRGERAGGDLYNSYT